MNPRLPSRVAGKCFQGAQYLLVLSIRRITEADPEGGEGGSSPGQILNP